ncbi:MAG: hypothetical protein A2233_01935 [Candidatus Kerfeldbacteria bacterium RIFOXYA2_FULL_38_24]|nr:MAG: hypothetical protein A2233_01935 [Candidatus Kerfeldbacteria bacterium RIFOXYA2_FULL_38_24]
MSASFLIRASSPHHIVFASRNSARNDCCGVIRSEPFIWNGINLFIFFLGKKEIINDRKVSVDKKGRLYFFDNFVARIVFPHLGAPPIR